MLKEDSNLLGSKVWKFCDIRNAWQVSWSTPLQDRIAWNWISITFSSGVTRAKILQKNKISDIMLVFCNTRKAFPVIANSKRPSRRSPTHLFINCSLLIGAASTFSDPESFQTRLQKNCKLTIHMQRPHRDVSQEVWETWGEKNTGLSYKAVYTSSVQGKSDNYTVNPPREYLH